MSYYPVFLDIKDQKVIIVGGGEVAERKVRNLLTYGCRIYINAHHLTQYLNNLVTEGKINRVEYNEIPAQMKDAFMAIAATDDPLINREVSVMAKKQRVLINAVDQPDDCSFIVSSVVKRGDLHIAISTGGKSPALAKRIRKELESSFGEEYGILVDLMGLIRKKILALNKPLAENKEIFEKLANADLHKFIRKNDRQGLKGTLISILGDEFPIDDVLEKAISF
ncbi:MAG: bifunctional precorrin-2 dehydrogenase/sirohydrochlorin ferrochelatase [Thermodesulfobacteriota bacterium]|nr:bifunctional precorrin-2 dehydrogenase/sirohydrochlorin ferrochelatase [Thermodesulfobacteriota bacterium]